MDINSSISLLSHIHSITADFLIEKLKEKGLPDFASSHGNILFQLSRFPKISMNELAEKINRDKSTTTVLVRKLEAEGFVKTFSSDSDKRTKFITLTEKGSQYNKLTKEISQSLNKTFYKGFTEQEKETFVSLLEKINKNFS